MVGNIKSNQNGFSLIEVVIVLIIVGIIGAVGYNVSHRKNATSKRVSVSSLLSTSKVDKKTLGVSWAQAVDGYKPDGTTPICQARMIKQFPADINKITSVLYPGQYRAGVYRTYGGFRFDKSANDEISVKAPFDGTLIDGGAFIADGTDSDVQYTFDVINDCGMMYRIGHLLTLSKQMANIARVFPAAATGDLRTTNIEPGVRLKAGTLLATAVGTASGKNVFFDFGVYDWRKPNLISTFPAWLADTQHNNSFGKHGICWLSELSVSDAAKIRSLPPGDSIIGKTSDYCK